MKKLVFSILFLFILASCAECKQVLPENIVSSTIKINAVATGEKGKNFFYCDGTQKCSTEDFVKEYYKKQGYNVMRGEVSVWQGFYALAFFDEIYCKHNFDFDGDLPRHFFENDYLYLSRKKMFDGKFNYLLNADISEFINSQLDKYAVTSSRLLHDAKIENYIDCTDYFYSDVVQEFLKRIDNKTFAQIVYKIAQNPNQNRAGIPDYVVWNDKELIFIEVKRKNENLREKQIEWAEFLIKNNIPYKVVRVISTKE